MQANYLDADEEQKKQVVNDYLASKLPPELKERYAARRREALALQEQSYHGPQALDALNEGIANRNLAASLQKAANQFGSNPLDGKVSSSYNIDDDMNAANKLDASIFDQKNKQYSQAVENERTADSDLRSFDDYNRGVESYNDDKEYQRQIRPLDLQSKQLSVDEKQSEIERDNAPVNEYTKTVAEETLSKIGMGGKVPWDKITNKDLEANPFLKSVIAKSVAGVAGKPVLRDLRDADGVVRTYALHSDGTKELVGDKGFAPNVYTDPVTGHKVERSVNGPRNSYPQPQASNKSPNPSEGIPNTGLLPGETPKQRDVRIGLETDATKERMKRDAKDESAVKDAGEKLAAVSQVENELIALHKKSVLSGPVLGQIGQAGTKLGVSLDDNAQLFEARKGQWANAYIKEISGAGVPDVEYVKRFKPLLPEIGDSEATVKNKLKIFKQTVQDEFNVKANRNLPAQAPATSQPQGRKVYVPGGK